jgi:large subunit ribosomal protein L25
MTPLAVEVDRREFVTALLTDAGMNVLLDLDIEGEEATLVLTKELQRNPVRGTLLHADFIKIDRTQEVEVEVPLHLVGEAPGAGEGGVLEHPTSSVLVRARATEVPGGVDVDISSLNIGDSLRIADLPTSDTFQILTDPDTIVASVSEPVSEAELQALEEDAGVVHEATDEEEAAAAEAAPEASGESAPDEGAGDADASS